MSETAGPLHKFVSLQMTGPIPVVGTLVTMGDVVEVTTTISCSAQAQPARQSSKLETNEHASKQMRAVVKGA